MSKLAKLKKELEGFKAQGLALVEAAEAENRDFTDDEQAKFDALESEIDRVKGEIATVEQMAERRRNMAGVPTGRNSVNDLNPEETGGFANLGEFAASVHHAVRSRDIGGVVDPRLVTMAQAEVHQGGQTDGEGYMLPPQYRDQIWELVTGFDEFGGVIDEEPTARREVKLYGDETTPWASAGITAYWRAEGTKMDASKLEATERNVPLHELYTLALATEELLEDAPRLNNRLGRKAAQAIAWKKNLAIVEGNGVGQPLGWMKGKSLIKVGKKDGQVAGTLVAENIIDMFARLQTIPGDKPFWMINRDVLPQLMFLKIADKPMWVPSNGMADAPGGYLLGLPIRFSEFAESIGTCGDIQLISPMGYYGARRASGIKHDTSIHLYFDYNVKAFRWVFRYGGQPHLIKPVTPAKGGATRSHFITLADRK